MLPQWQLFAALVRHFECYIPKEQEIAGLSCPDDNALADCQTIDDLTPQVKNVLAGDLTELVALKEQGLLSQEEFAAAKKRLFS